jgi:hypothetical protein
VALRKPRLRWLADLQVAAPGLLALDRLEQRLEVPLAEPLRAMRLDQLEEHRRPVLRRLGEDLQQVAVTATIQMAGLDSLTYVTAYLDECGRNGGSPCGSGLLRSREAPPFSSEGSSTSCTEFCRPSPIVR